MKNREAARDRLAALLDAKLVTDLGIVQEVVGHKVDDLGGASPVVAVLSAGSARPPMTFAGRQTMFYLDVQVWVLYSDGDAWGPAEAEDRADLIEKEIAEIVAAKANQVTDDWGALDYAERSVAADVTTSGGTAYLLEIIPLEVSVYA